MPAPIVNSITFDKPNGYTKGDLVTATVQFVPGTSALHLNFTDTETDVVTGLTGSLSASFSVSDPDATTGAAHDDGNHVWTEVTGQPAGTRVWTTTA